MSDAVPSPARKRRWRWILPCVVGIVIGFVVGAVAGSSGNTKTTTIRAAAPTVTVTDPGQEPVAAPEPDPMTDPPPLPDPDPTANTTTKCDYLLGDFSTGGSNGYRFVGSIDVQNTSDPGTGIVVRATAHWDQLGGEPVRLAKTFRVRPESSRTVQFKLIVSQDQIDQLQSADGKCGITAHIVDTF